MKYANDQDSREQVSRATVEGREGQEASPWDNQESLREEDARTFTKKSNLLSASFPRSSSLAPIYPAMAMAHPSLSYSLGRQPCSLPSHPFFGAHQPTFYPSILPPNPLPFSFHT